MNATIVKKTARCNDGAARPMRLQLAVASGYVEALIDGSLIPTPDCLHTVLSALNRLDAQISAFVPSADVRVRASHPGPVDLCALIVRETIAIEALADAAGVTLDIEICTRKHQSCSRFVCDALQVGQVFTNVLINAIKYAGRGGRVKLDSHLEHGMLRLEISDNGPGIATAERQTIFERGVRGSAAAFAGGSGFGLAVVRSILDAHGGSVTVADSVLGGASFVIRLPGITNDADACDPHRYLMRA